MVCSKHRTADARHRRRPATRKIPGLLLAAIFLLCAHAATARPSARGQAPDVTPLQCTPREVPDFIWGLTATNVEHVGDMTAALTDLRTAFPQLAPGELPPIMVRVVFDPSKNAAEYQDSLKHYQDAVAAISQHAYVLGTIADSYDWYPYVTPASDASASGQNNYRRRTEQLVRAMGDCVQVWEVGNEVNGEWTGWKDGNTSGDRNKRAAMRVKIGGHITEAFNAVRAYNDTVAPASRKRTALTLLYNSDGPTGSGRTCYDKPEYEMRSWAQSYVGSEVRTGVDYVLLSYYENKGDCFGLRQDAATFVANFRALAEPGMFPHAKFGFGEVGYKATCPKKAEDREQKRECEAGKPSCRPEEMCIGQKAYILKYYQRLNGEIRAALAGQRPEDGRPLDFVGGYFYWYFIQDMTGKNREGDDSGRRRNRDALKRAMSWAAFK